MMLAVDSDEPRGGHAESAICNSTGSAIRPTIQGKPSYHFSVKRPRRNVTKRSIATLPYLKSVQEEKEDTTRTYQDGRDLYRAPRLAFSLLLFVYITRLRPVRRNALRGVATRGPGANAEGCRQRTRALAVIVTRHASSIIAAELRAKDAPT